MIEKKKKAVVKQPYGEGKGDGEKFDLLKYTPYFFAYLVSLGIVFQWIYYKAFNLKIFNYLELSEILTSFLDNLILISIGLLIGFGFGTFCFLSFPPTAKQIIKKENKLMEERKFKKRFRIYLKTDPIFLSVSIILPPFSLFLIVLLIIRFNPLKHFLTLWGFILAQWLLILSYYEIKRKVISISEDSEKYLLIFVFAVFIVIYVVFVAYMQVADVKDGTVYSGTQFQLDNGMYRDRLIIFITQVLAPCPHCVGKHRSRFAPSRRAGTTARILNIKGQVNYI